MCSTTDRALYHELVLFAYANGRKQVTLPLLTKPLENQVVKTCLYGSIPIAVYPRCSAHAISETVEEAKQLGMESLSGVVNAILRRATRETEQFYDVLEQASICQVG